MCYLVVREDFLEKMTLEFTLSKGNTQAKVYNRVFRAQDTCGRPQNLKSKLDSTPYTLVSNEKGEVSETEICECNKRWDHT